MSVLWSHLKRAKLRIKCCLLASLGDTTFHTVAMVFKVVQIHKKKKKIRRHSRDFFPLSATVPNLNIASLAVVDKSERL